jgi:hypothetical protein
MKTKISFAIIVVFALTILAPSIPVNAVQQQVTANAVQGTPIIDGELDDVYTYGTKMEIKNFHNFANSGTDAHLPTMATGFAYIAWDQNNIYEYFEISDPTPVKTTVSASSDAIECTFDFGNLMTDGAGFVESYGPEGIFEKTIAYAETLGQADLQNQWDDNNGYVAYARTNYDIVVKITSTGYIIENRLPVNKDSAILTNGFYEGYSFGHAISILDDVDDDGSRDMKITWGSNDGDLKAGDMLNNSSRCDKILLVAAPVLEVIEETAAETAAPSAPAVDAPPQAPAETPAVTAPQTGDEVYFFAAILIISTTAAAVIYRKRKLS